jgi:hypothetical protein
MMVVLGILIAQLKLVFPARIDAPNYSKPLKDRDDAVKARAIHLASR